jgi:hypothetical protein
VLDGTESPVPSGAICPTIVHPVCALQLTPRMLSWYACGTAPG